MTKPEPNQPGGSNRATTRVALAAAGLLIVGVLLAGCGDDDSAAAEDSDPAAVVEDYRVSYNGGDIEEVMTAFTDESVITGHPFADESAGLAEIRSLHLGDMSAAAQTDAYEFSNIEVSGDTVTWDHVWLNDDGEEWCAEGHSAVITDGQIITWTFAPNPDLCA